jgi:hypothetical protein
MTTSIDTHLVTGVQQSQLDRDISDIGEKLQSITRFIRARYGDNSQSAIRADETAGALQRLKWELERVQQKTRAATA